MEKNSKAHVLFVLVTFGVTVVIGSYQQETALTREEKIALDKFKTLVIPKIPSWSFLQNYKNDDLYFIRWLRAKSLDITAATNQFENHLKWREDMEMDTIDDEDWAEFHKDYPIFVDTVDKEGKPTGEIWFGDWNLRRGVLAGKARQIQRWMFRLFELQTRQLYKARASGKEISQAVIIATMEGFNVVQQACPACLPTYLQFINTFQNQYPGNYDKVFGVGAPPTAEIVWSLMRPVMNPQTKNLLHLISRKEQWMKALNEVIDKDQRSVRFGGTLVRDNYL